MTYNGKMTAKDRITALVTALVIFLVGAFNLDNNCDWGDDFAAYLTDGIAIAEGNYKAQTHINYVLRTGHTDSTEVHVHAFGMPLIHSFVYKLFGFDTVGFSNLYVYKLPSLLLFALAAGVFFLFLKKRFDYCLSVFGCVLLFSGPFFFRYIRNLGNDVIFLSLALMSFYWGEKFVSEEDGKYRKGVFLGFLLWSAYSVRLNGISVLPAIILLHVIELIRTKRKLEASDFCPYIAFFLLFLVFNCLIFPKPTSTSSIIGDFEVSRLTHGIVYYSEQLYIWASDLVDTLLTHPVRTAIRILFPGKNPITFYRYFNTLFTSLFFLLILIGIITDGIKRNIHLTVFSLLTFLASASLMLGQDLRYLLVILPFLVMYFCFGVKRIISKINFRKFCKKPLMRGALTCIACALLLCPMIKADIDNVNIPDREFLTAYSDGAVDIYDYISSKIDGDAVIAFFKPRALYLNTGRISVLPGQNGVTIASADYYLYYKPDPDFLIPDELLDRYELTYENTEFSLYRFLG